MLVDRGDEIRDLVRQTRPLPLALALLVGLAQLALSAGFWQAALAAVGERHRYRPVLEAGVRSLPARYLPGGVWYAVGRAAILRRRGASLTAVGTAAALETGLSLTIGVGLGSLLLLGAGSAPARPVLLATVAVLLGIACSPPVVNRFLALVARRRGGVPAVLGWRRWAGLVAWTVAFWAGAATMFSLYLHAFPNIELRSVPEVTGAFMISWVLGFLAFFAPQGVGVFEVTVAALVTSEPVGGVALVVGGYRVLTLVRDLLVLGTASLLGSHGRQADLPAGRQGGLAAPPAGGHEPGRG